ncbi:hypothetical protein B0H13DRAFT_2563799 [Mycena leptocephala]|nr:hypothetical protein B0H13DRAFT_2563799 [Mycena leptocephala]
MTIHSSLSNDTLRASSGCTTRSRDTVSGVEAANGSDESWACASLRSLMAAGAPLSLPPAFRAELREQGAARMKGPFSRGAPAAMYRTTTAPSDAGAAAANVQLCAAQAPCPYFLCAGCAHGQVPVRGAGVTACVRRGYLSALLARDPLAEGEAGVHLCVRDAGGEGSTRMVEGDEIAHDWWCAWRLSEELRAMWMSLGAMRCLGSMAGLRCEAARFDACDGVESAAHAPIHRCIYAMQGGCAWMRATGWKVRRTHRYIGGGLSVWRSVDVCGRMCGWACASRVYARRVCIDMRTGWCITTRARCITFRLRVDGKRLLLSERELRGMPACGVGVCAYGGTVPGWQNPGCIYAMRGGCDWMGLDACDGDVSGHEDHPCGCLRPVNSAVDPHPYGRTCAEAYARQVVWGGQGSSGVSYLIRDRR